ncbi:hypothetical protein BDY24DRAFT_372933 [Mrakia frigida]|uniref:queuosine 5'-phosphate N-glycosylase/hydrolase n=1 Tax=Mrakia frigida TaxID=29902 RepID=UPI003FCC085F
MLRRKSLSTTMTSSFSPSLLRDHPNPVINSAYKIHAEAKHVQVTSPSQVKAAAQALLPHLSTYSPLSWKTQPLHLLPSPSPCSTLQPSGPFPTLKLSPTDKEALDWIFFVSSLNFSFWSELPSGQRWGVEWCENGWEGVGGNRKRWEGYWGLLAVVNSALESSHPLTTPSFYSSPSNAALIRTLFAPTPPSTEKAPLLGERLALLQQNGSILCERFGGSWAGFLEGFVKESRGGALDLVKEIVSVFEGFRDEGVWEGEKVFFWKRAQILVAETWAAFHPPLTSPPTPHPIFPDGLGDLSMFPDYRVPQHLHTLSLLSYSPHLLSLLDSHTNFPHGSPIEMEIRAGSIVAIEEVRKALKEMRNGEDTESVVLDFLIWDLAKEKEAEVAKGGGEGEKVVECHRTRSIWY